MKKYIVLISIFLAACNRQPATSVAAPEESNENLVSLTAEQIKTGDIVTGMAQIRSVASVLKATGAVDVPPQSLVSISFPLGGYLKSTHLLPGMHVNKGEVLAVLEDPQYVQLQQDYLMAKTRLAFLETDFVRQEDLNRSKASSDKTFQQAKADFESQKILMKSLSEKLLLIGINPNTLTESNLSRSVNVYSPINGFVSSVRVNIGKYVSPTDVMFEVVDPDDIHLNLMIFEKDVDKIKVGQKVWAYTNQDPEDKHEAEVILVSKNINADRTVEVHCHFENYEQQLLPGMFMNVEVETRNDSALTVPEEGVVNWQNQNYVLVETAPNTFQLTPVQTAATDHGFVAITNPEAQEWKQKKIIIKNAYAVLMKMKNTAEED